jgi:hypothetical protein
MAFLARLHRGQAKNWVGPTLSRIRAWRTRRKERAVEKLAREAEGIAEVDARIRAETERVDSVGPGGKPGM